MEKKYVIDFERLMSFVFDEDEYRNVDSEITETYIPDDGNMMLTSKQYREVKGGDTNSKQTIKYDLVKTMIEMLEMEGLNNVTFREELILNSLLNEGIIKEVNIE